MLDKTPSQHRAARIWLLLITFISVMGADAWLNAQSQPSTNPQQAYHLTDQQRLMRDQFDALKHSGPNGIPPLARTRAIAAMDELPKVGPGIGTWSFIGPDSISNGQ